MLLTSFYKEGTDSGTRAEIHEIRNGYRVDYYTAGAFSKKEVFESKSIDFVQNVAENWLSGVKALNG